MAAPGFLDRYQGVVRDEYAESLRIPLVDSAHPRWNFITSVLVGDIYDGVRPVNAELDTIASFHQFYLDEWYAPAELNVMAEKPFDVDGGANGRILLKRADGLWAYRRRSWRLGPLFVPSLSHRPRSLVDILDLANANSSRWSAWKTANSEYFPEGS